MSSKKIKSINLAELTKLLDGRLVGSSDIEITGVASIVEAGSSDITFLSGAKNYSSHLKSIDSSKAIAIIAPDDAPELPIPSIRFKNSYEGFAKALQFFSPVVKPCSGMHPTAFVHENANVSEDATIGPMAVVEAGANIYGNAWIGARCFVGENASIGANSMLHPNVSLLRECEIGKDCIIHSGAVIGSDGFGFTPINGRQVKVPQIGNVIIADDVEIGANVTIDRATMGSTIIGTGTRIDNMVHIAHNVVIGKHCIIVAQVGISGSTILEDSVTLAGQVGTVGHVRIGKGTTVAARGVVTNDVAPGSFVSGFPIKPHVEERKILAATRRLPDLLKKVRAIEKKLDSKE